VLRSRPCCSYKASWKGAALRFNGIRSCQLELRRIAVDSETPAEGRQWRRLRRCSAQRMQNRPHGSATDLTRNPVTQIQIPCQSQCPLGAPYLVRTCDVTAQQSPAGRRSVRWRARSVQCRLEQAVPRRGAPAEMAFVVFVTPQEPRKGPPIPTSALWAVFRYHHQQLHGGGGCATRPRQVVGGTCSASQARPFSSCCHQLGGKRSAS
jgi:hypothetical protein